MHNSCLNPGLKKNKKRKLEAVKYILGKIQWGKCTHCQYVIHCFAYDRLLWLLRIMNLFLGHIESFRSEVWYMQFTLKCVQKER